MRTMLDAKVDAVVFDLGGVLVDWDPRHLYRKIIPDEAARESFLGDVCTPEWNARMDRGVPFAKAIPKKQQDHPEWAAEIAAYFERWPEMLAGPIEGSVAILEELYSQGTPLYALTNWSAETFRHAEARFDFLDLFRDIVVSGKERLAKPAVEFYCILIDRHGLEPARTLFIDDQEKNVQAARLAGMKSVRFTTPEAVRNELVNYGLLRP